MLDANGHSLFGAIRSQRRCIGSMTDEYKSEARPDHGCSGIHYYVRDLERSRRFYTEQLDFAEIGQSSPGSNAPAGSVPLCSRPALRHRLLEPAGRRRAGVALLGRHPDGVGTLAFEVEDIERPSTSLDRAGGNPISEIQTERDEGWY